MLLPTIDVRIYVRLYRVIGHVILNQSLSLEVRILSYWVGQGGTGGRGYVGTGVRGYGATWIRGYVDTWVRVYGGTRVRGYGGTRVCGNGGTWARGYVGMRGWV